MIFFLNIKVSSLYYFFKICLLENCILYFCNLQFFSILILLILFLINLNKKKLYYCYKKNVFYAYKNKFVYKYFILNFKLLVFFLAVYYLYLYNDSVKNLSILNFKKFKIINATIDFSVCLDYTNIYFIILNFFIFSLITLTFFNTKYIYDINKKQYKLVLIFFIVIEICLVLTFVTSNIFFFFFFFECSLMPLYFLLIILGKGAKKKHFASLLLVFYTLSGSIFLLLAILILLFKVKHADFKILNFEQIDFNTQIVLFIFFILGFSVKVPMFPFHSWLPEAHVEASTPLSILLASIFLKVATYGILKIVVFNFFLSIIYMYSLIFYFCLISILLASFIVLSQTDIKKIIALSSIIHMNYIIIGLLSCDPKAILGSIIYMFSHAFVSTGLFYIVGVLYDNKGTRDLFNFNNNIKYSQNFFFYFFLLNLSNVSLPGTISFVAELVIFNSLLYINLFMLIIILSSVFISIIYTFWLVHNVFFGKNILIKNVSFLNIFDLYVLNIILIIIFVLGIFPFLFLFNFEQEVYLQIISKINTY